MRKLVPVIIVFNMMFQGLSSQEQRTITLDSCYSYARMNHPATADRMTIDKITQARIENIRTMYLPRLELMAQATYQSDIIDLDIDLPIPNLEFPTPTKDQYKVALDISQVIYDGGATKARKELEEVSAKAEKQQVEVNLYQLFETVNRLYFAILLLQEQERVLALTGELLDERITLAKEGNRLGVVTTQDLKSLQVERLKLKQKEIELDFTRKGALDALSVLTNHAFGEKESFSVPEISVSRQGARPETGLFLMKQQQLQSSGKLLQVARRPKLSAFGQFGYGKPGLNMLNDQFDTYYIVGARLAWNIWDWSNTRRSIQEISLRSQLIGNQQQAFDQKVEVELASEQAEIEKYEQLMKDDQTIIELHDQILSGSEAAFANGTITATDFLADLNALYSARIRQAIHRLSRLRHIASYNIKSGNL